VFSYGDTYVSSSSNGLRPCFSLRSDIKITGGDGQSEATAYTMRYLEEKMQLRPKVFTAKNMCRAKA